MSETVNEILEPTTEGRTLVARVLSARMDKSASVELTRMVRHPVYGKFVRRRTRLLAHDEANECHAGDVVAIAPCRPLSRRKSWRVTAVLQRGGDVPATNDEGASA